MVSHHGRARVSDPTTREIHANACIPTCLCLGYLGCMPGRLCHLSPLVLGVGLWRKLVPAVATCGDHHKTHTRQCFSNTSSGWFGACERTCWALVEACLTRGVRSPERCDCCWTVTPQHAVTFHWMSAEAGYHLVQIAWLAHCRRAFSVHVSTKHDAGGHD